MSKQSKEEKREELRYLIEKLVNRYNKEWCRDEIVEILDVIEHERQLAFCEGMEHLQSVGIVKEKKESHPYAEICKEANFKETSDAVKIIVKPYWKRYKSFPFLIKELSGYVTRVKSESFKEGINYSCSVLGEKNSKVFASKTGDPFVDEDTADVLRRGKVRKVRGKKRTVKCGCCHCKADRKQKKEDEEAYKRETELIKEKLKMFRMIVGLPTK